MSTDNNGSDSEYDSIHTELVPLEDNAGAVLVLSGVNIDDPVEVLRVILGFAYYNAQDAGIDLESLWKEVKSETSYSVGDVH